MNIDIGTKIGPWIIGQIMNSTALQCLAVVHLEGDTAEWVMKISPTRTEYNIIQKLNLQSVGIDLYKDELYAAGKYNKLYWFVMEKYDSDCMLMDPIAFDCVIFVADVMRFLKYIHQTYNMIHSDLKLDNVLYRGRSYFVCDYEYIMKPEIMTICDEDDTDNYYYYIHGAEYGKPVHSYRYDFEAVGIMLMVAANGHKYLPFQEKAKQYYEAKSSINHFPELEVLKAQWKMPTRLETYFEIIKKVEWTCIDPPDVEIYDKIISIFWLV